MRPNYGELAFILIAGGLQPVIEILTNSQISTYYNIVVILIALVYVIYRIAKLRGSILHKWGFRTDNINRSIIPYLIFSVVGSIVIYLYGWYVGNTPLPIEFWYVLAMYPVWGILQQFALQNFVAKNLVTLVPSLPLRSFIVALIFACAHIPSVELTVLTFVAGFIITYLYHHFSNLIVLGFVHGILGALVFHLVLGQNQWGILVKYFS